MLNGLLARELDAAYTASLAQISDGVTFDRPLAPGVWAAHPTGVPALLRPLAGPDAATAGQVLPPVPARRPAGADLQALRDGVRGGQGARLQDQRTVDHYFQRAR